MNNSKITNLTINKSKHHEAAEDVADLSVKDILEKHLHIQGEFQPKRHSQHLETVIVSPRRPQDSAHNNTNKGDRELASPTRSAGGRIHSPSPGNRQEYSVIPSRSMTPHDFNSLVVGNSNSENSSEIEAKSTRNTPKRSGIVKQPLHKTNAAKGVTFAAGYKGVDTSYIQITKKISMRKDTEKVDTQSNGTNSDDSSTVIQSVLDENKTVYVGTSTEDAYSKNIQETQEESPVKVEDEASDESPRTSSTVQLETRKSNQSSDIQYTINIPTAEEAESEINF